MARTYSAAGPAFSVCTGTALSQGSQCDQSSYPECRVCSIRSPRKPVQSMNRSPSTTSPEAIARDSMKPDSAFWLTPVILPSTRRTP